MSKYTDELRQALGIRNARDIALKYGCVLVYFYRFHPHAFGHHDYRAETYRVVDGKERARTFRAHGFRGLKAAQERLKCVELAQEWAAERFGVADWAPTGFQDTWMPKDVKERMHADLLAWRKEQRAKEKAT
ncbi:hypothetical protein ACPCSE_29210 [Streptomyces cellulosae]